MTGHGSQGNHIAFGDFRPSSQKPALLEPTEVEGSLQGVPTLLACLASLLCASVPMASPQPQ